VEQDELESVGGSGFASAEAGVGAAGATAAQVDFFAQYLLRLSAGVPAHLRRRDLRLILLSRS
jgi:hypothetical protein